MNLHEPRNCVSCGKKIMRYKYCKGCALIAKKEQIKASNHKIKCMSIGIKIEQKIQAVVKDFAWDEPNCPDLGI